MLIIALTFKEELNLFLKNNALYLALGFIGLILLTIFLILFFSKKRKGKSGN